MNRGGWPATLACLAFRRVVPIASWIGASLLILAVRWRETERAGALVELSGKAVSGPDALVRQGLWTVATLLFLPWCVMRAAGTFARWRAGELDFIAPRAAPRPGLVLATWIGHACAALVLLALVVVAAEVTSERRASFRAADTVALARAGWITGTAPLASRIPEASVPASVASDSAGPGPSENGSDTSDGVVQSSSRLAPGTRAGARLAVELVLGAGAGPAAEVVLRARRGRDESRSSQRIGMRGRLEVDVPAGTGPIDLVIEVGASDARVLLPSPHAELWLTATDARAASVAFLLELALCALSASAVAFGLGAFLAPVIASLATLSLWILPGLFGPVPDWLPGARLFAALEIVGDGRIPQTPHLAACLGAFAIVCGALALPSVADGPWRRSR